MDRLSATAAGLSVLIGLAGAGVAVAQGLDGGGDAPAAAAPDQGRLEARPAAPRPMDALVEPVGAAVEISLQLDEEDSVQSLLLRSGATEADAAEAATLISAATPAGIPDEAGVTVVLGDGSAEQGRRVERVWVEPSAAFKLIVGRDSTGRLRLVREALAVDASPRKFEGEVGGDLFWSMRASGVPAEAAREYIEVLSSRIRPDRHLLPSDRFALVIDHLRTAQGESRAGPLLYAGLRRRDGRQLHLVRWSTEGEAAWFEPGNPRQRVEGFEQPVRGSVSSRFGHRVHPILRTGRFHTGVDMKAAWGTQVVAAADGTVIAAEWNGGHGRQVRLAHSNGVATSYSHLSRMVAVPGAQVRRGEVIGYVGSSGFSTGPHLHYEVRRNGRPVDPLSFRHATVTRISAAELAALRARLEQLRSI